MDKLGIEPKLLIAQIVNFAIIVFVLSKLLYKPILGMLEKRKKEIAEGLNLTAKMREEEEKFEEKKQKMLVTVRKEGQDIIEEARKQAKEEEKEIIAEAHKEAEVILLKARADIDHERLAMQKQVQASAVELAIAMAKRLLTGVLSNEEKHAMIAKHVSELESMKSV
ncbi:MAG TPA: F0F1 ATP synthase subunit B [Patescibacteria group bacterium]|jgi:F-type H+-transporting ATPase subunit b|nr:F0F1 ATP synthase subunit B [Patescibacteria group bacterium]